jgi:hypothetical protein
MLRRSSPYVAAALLLGAAAAHAATGSPELDAAVLRLAEGLSVSSGCVTAVVAFTRPDGGYSPAGETLAAALAAALKRSPKMTTVPALAPNCLRARLGLGLSGTVDPVLAMTAGRALGARCLAVGTVAADGTMLSMSARLIDARSGLRLAEAESSLPLDAALRFLLPGLDTRAAAPSRPGRVPFWLHRRPGLDWELISRTLGKPALSDAEGVCGVAHLRRLSGDCAGATALYNAVLTRVPSASARLGLALCAPATEALHYSAEALSDAPEDAYVSWLAGVVSSAVHIETDDAYAAEIERRREVGGRAVLNGEFLLARALVLLDRGQRDAARLDLLRALSSPLCPEDRSFARGLTTIR